MKKLLCLFIVSLLLAGCTAKTYYYQRFRDIDNTDNDLIIEQNKDDDSTYHISIGIYRLAGFDAERATKHGNVYEFTCMDPSENLIKGTVEVKDTEAIVTFTDSNWRLIENGTQFTYYLDK